MTLDRRLKILLIVSVAINIFLLGAGVSAAVLGTRMFHDRMDRQGPMMVRAGQALPEEERMALRRMMRTSAVAAAPKLRAAREARREAARLIAMPDYDPTAVAVALAQARDNEAQARAQIDAALVAFLPNLTPERRAALAEVMAMGRMGGRGERGGPFLHRRGPPDGPPPPPLEGRTRGPET